MILNQPCKISARLGPALRIGDGWLTLLTVKPDNDGRERATFALDTPEFEHIDSELRSGVGGFRSLVEAFEVYLCFMEAAADAYRYGPGSDNYDIFPEHVMQWAAERADELAMARSQLQDENGRTLDDLIGGEVYEGR